MHLWGNRGVPLATFFLHDDNKVKQVDTIFTTVATLTLSHAYAPTLSRSGSASRSPCLSPSLFPFVALIDCGVCQFSTTKYVNKCLLSCK